MGASAPTTMENQEIPAKQGALDLQALVNNLDKRGLLVLQILLGQRAIQVLEAEKEPQTKVPFKSSLLLPR